MKIWLCQIGETPVFDEKSRKMRNSQLALELQKRGCEVTWWCSAFDHNKKQWRLESECNPNPLPNLKMKYLRGCGYRTNISIKRFLDHRLIAKTFKAEARKEEKPDLILASIPAYDLSYQAEIGRAHV